MGHIGINRVTLARTSSSLLPSRTGRRLWFVLHSRSIPEGTHITIVSVKAVLRLAFGREMSMSSGREIHIVAPVEPFSLEPVPNRKDFRLRSYASCSNEIESCACTYILITLCITQSYSSGYQRTSWQRSHVKRDENSENHDWDGVEARYLSDGTAAMGRR